MNLDELKALGNRLLINYADNRRPENFKELMLEWKRILEKHDAELVNKNLDEHLEKSVYFPKLAELVKEREIKSNTPGALETRLMIEQTERETTPVKKSDPEYIKKQIEIARQKIAEVKLNELDRKFNRTC